MDTADQERDSMYYNLIRRFNETYDTFLREAVMDDDEDNQEKKYQKFERTIKDLSKNGCRYNAGGVDFYYFRVFLENRAAKDQFEFFVNWEFFICDGNGMYYFPVSNDKAAFEELKQVIKDNIRFNFLLTCDLEDKSYFYRKLRCAQLVLRLNGISHLITLYFLVSLPYTNRQSYSEIVEVIQIIYKEIFLSQNKLPEAIRDIIIDNSIESIMGVSGSSLSNLKHVKSSLIKHDFIGKKNRKMGRHEIYYPEYVSGEYIIFDDNSKGKISLITTDDKDSFPINKNPTKSFLEARRDFLEVLLLLKGIPSSQNTVSVFGEILNSALENPKPNDSFSLNIDDIVEKVKLSNSNVYPKIETLIESGYIEKPKNSVYRLDPLLHKLKPIFNDCCNYSFTSVIEISTSKIIDIIMYEKKQYSASVVSENSTQEDPIDDFFKEVGWLN